MTLIAAMKNLTPSASSMGMSKSSVAGGSYGGAMQGANRSAGLFGCGPCLPDIHVNVDVDVHINLSGCSNIDACIHANINIC
ncbi:hypothetical protein SAMD00019534_095880 [Acytostelium subglobosum LB1]|uniref:hypothetical protein n=1 Tax=Acytostelium subglobosum LB1 TaxID=1410327 RepID=UPI0006451775|nr:hypothetical protein SAMD00019534_095870 [Acytostelium subglobosum LB1]XP_012750509.1 hypothetical protein SAMD00019534_095880 [Acytostelium subglobosum LB1]GAM26412.1 hypothetical protein SAMD00019534_095870 [Acytostelium subglobosum LB1]GAM26413.1 hypothetical protein SAMD00019534_095880 [Acytostelium subglobosum LB1]|eukprot:XP_012750508.1 hypothetical protein SAMD00019534_095870 [Acytostelium subglobosum LB1]